MIEEDTKDAFIAVIIFLLFMSYITWIYYIIHSDQENKCENICFDKHFRYQRVDSKCYCVQPNGDLIFQAEK